MKHYDFCGYVTKNDIRCSDGRTIRHGAFRENDGTTVPLVWNHRHNDPTNILGHVLLENRDDGVYGYCAFNDSARAQETKLRVMHGDINQMSIYANQLRSTNNGDVMHGNIREVSLVLAGANPGAFIEAVDIQHSDDPEYEQEFGATIYTGENFELFHADKDEKPTLDKEESTEEKTKESDKEEKEMATKTTNDDKSVMDAFNEFTDEQKQIVYFMIGKALEEAEAEDEGEEAKHSAYNDEEDYIMHNNVFENNSAQNEFLQHADAFFADTEEIFKDAKKHGSLKDSVIEHAAANGITNIDYLFPDARTLENTPDFIRRDDTWVEDFMGKVRRSPFSRVKSIHADITESTARAKGYTKGNLKAEEVFSLLKRITPPTTIYKKQKIDRDDVLDITDFDVIAWIKSEMRIMLNEEIARACLIGDGRTAGTDDKINEQCIRPIWTDSELYTIHSVTTVAAAATDDQKAKAVIVDAIKSRKDFKGTGTPTLYISNTYLTDMLLLTDGVGRDLYDTVDKLATKLRVGKIVTVDSMENLTRTVTVEGVSQTRSLIGIIVNPADYNIGADKGGEVSLFDDFDIDYNQQKYLIETRMSGALVKPKSAIALEMVTAS